VLLLSALALLLWQRRAENTFGRVLEPI